MFESADPVDAIAGLEPEPSSAAMVFRDRLPLARLYVRMLATDGVVRGLIGPREAGRLWTRHVLNCAAPAELIPPGARIVDVGSGAGLPGVVLAIARPDCRVVLLEPLERRVRFLTEVVDRLGLNECLVVRARAQDAPAQARGADVVVSRAVAPLGRLAGWCAGLARPGGVVLALKGSTAQEELVRDAADLAAAGLRDAEVVALDGPAGPAHVVRAVRGPDQVRSRRPSTGRGSSAGRRASAGRASAAGRDSSAGPGSSAG
ncbi:16S rRNA (guanine(527)-N(7))-methyltransferase RsmG [Nakamurella sp.]|uniref:16S rRNA (guanine(527)-N(7))-methyltransferase RsmG n=1 Tax=Nakamurella sp. TaxID=1869182 RepID=UPI00378514F3